MSHLKKILQHADVYCSVKAHGTYIARFVVLTVMFMKIEVLRNDVSTLTFVRMVVLSFTEPKMSLRLLDHFKGL